MWVPDVYHGAPTAVSLFIGSASELAAFALVMRILVSGLGADYLVEQWQWMLIIMAVLSLAIGNVTAIAQTNLKRMLAYSAISHMGFLLLGVLSGTPEGYASAMFYVMIYVLMALGAFGVILLLSRAGFEADNLDDFKGLNQRSPWYAGVMALVMFSMAGVPPMAGFYAKLSVLSAVVDAGYLWLAVLAVLFSLIGPADVFRGCAGPRANCAACRHELGAQPEWHCHAGAGHFAGLADGFVRRRDRTVAPIVAASIQPVALTFTAL
jgi:NADH-quinone oxidoreductase subunit N